MSTSDASAGPRSGLANVVDIIVAPQAAFERLREVPAWGWAFVVATLLGIAGALLMGPAVAHAMDVSLPAQFAANPAIAKLPADQQQKQIAAMMGFTKTLTQLAWLFVPISILIAGVIQALLMTIANAIGHGAGSFKKYFALSVTVSVVGYGLYTLVLGIITTVRGAAAFEDTASVYRAVPSLALLVPSAQGALAGFLSGINVFYLWAAALLALGMQAIGRLSRPLAWGTAIVILLCAAGFVALGARQG